MNTANEKLYEWLEERSFEQLNPAEQKQVLQEMSAEEYTEMYLAIQLLDRQSRSGLNRGKEAVWASIADEMSEKKSVLPIWLNYRMPVAWAAAIVLLLGFTWLFSEMSQAPETVLLDSREHDTVFVEVPVKESVLVYDTVYLREENPSREAKPRLVQAKPKKQTNSSLGSDLHIETLANSKKPANELKGNSLYYDSLAAKIGFVSL